MKMLRDWNGAVLKPITEIITNFDISVSDLKLLKYERLTSDSFIWILDSTEGLFALYAEDYVPSLEHVTNAMKKHGTINEEINNFRLVKVKFTQNWGDSSPVLASDTYRPPKDEVRFMKYAVPSGLDFVFLGRLSV